MALPDAASLSQATMTSQVFHEEHSSGVKGKLNFSEIAAINAEEILAPLETKTNRKIMFTSVSEILGTENKDEMSPKFQQLVGDFLIFQMPILKEINDASERYVDEGYGKQGSRMAFHRPESIKKDFKAVLAEPEKNAFILVTDERTGEILGSISLLHCDNGLYELSNFYLAPELRRESGSDKIGLAKYLFSRMLLLAKHLGEKEVFLTSRRKGGFEHALSLFGQFGFKEVLEASDVNRLVRPEYQSSRTIPMLLQL